jgi:ribosomal protein S7
MKRKSLNIKNKLINNITLNGNKKISEKIVLKSLKELQKSSKKQSKELVKLALVQSTPIFKLHRISNKKLKKKNRRVKEIPAFIAKMPARTSLAIKFILTSIENKKSSNFYLKLKENLLLTSQAKGNAVKLKNELQKRTIQHKKFFKYYRW